MLKYLKLGFFGLKEELYNIYGVLARSVWLFVVVYLITAITLYGAHLKGMDIVGGIPTNMIIWYVFITEIIMVNRRNDDIVNQIKSGNIIFALNKPFHFIFNMLANGFFRTFLKVSVLGPLGALVIYAFISPFPWHGFMQLGLFLISFLIGILVLSLFAIFIGMFGFLFEDVTFIRFLINKIYFIFGGVFFPLTIYPQWLQNISNFLPFQYYFYFPAKFFVTGDLSFFLNLFRVQILWFLIILGLILGFYGKIVKNLEINGG